MCKPSLYDKLQAEPSMGQSGNTDTGKDIQVHINTVVPTDPGVNVPVGIPSTPVQERSSIASADRGGQGGGEGAMTDTPPSRTKRVKCVYTKEGVCNYHGEGAKEHSKPIIEIYYEKGVKKRRVKERIVQFVCDTDLSGKKKLKQPKISFIKKQISGEGGGDTTLRTRRNLGNLIRVQRGRLAGHPWRRGSMKTDETVYRHEIVDEKFYTSPKLLGCILFSITLGFIKARRFGITN